MALKPIAKQPAPKPKRMQKDRKLTIKLKPFVPHEVVQPPQTQTMLRGLSLKELIKASDPARQERANYVVHIETIKRLRTGKGLPAVEATAWYEDLLRPNSQEAHTRYTVQIVGLDDQTKPIYRQNRVLVSCACKDWVFRWEYANAIHGATRIIYGNGQPAVMHNPNNIPGLCKHSLAVAEHVLSSKW
jgi:hypothetical protein